MRKQITALLLALSMCLTLLSACGSGSNSDGPSAQGSAPGSEEQQASRTPEETKALLPEETKEQSPEETEKPEETQPPKGDPTGAQALALLKEEYKNSFTCYMDRRVFIYDGILYISGGLNQDGKQSATYGTYDISAKKIIGNLPEWQFGTGSDAFHSYFIDGNFYYCNAVADGKYYTIKCDRNGEVLGQLETDYSTSIFFENGILLWGNPFTIYSYDLEKIAEIPTPQHEVAHGIKEDMLVYPQAIADGTIYAKSNEDSYFRLNTSTYEWESAENISLRDGDLLSGRISFCGRYDYSYDQGKSYYGIFDSITGECIFKLDGLPEPVNGIMCYFGGDEYLGRNNDGYCWVNLKTGAVSDPLPFPEGVNNGIIVSDTYYVYEDEYGWFLWNYNTGKEETILLFDR